MIMVKSMLIAVDALLSNELALGLPTIANSTPASERARLAIAESAEVFRTFYSAGRVRLKASVILATRSRDSGAVRPPL